MERSIELEHPKFGLALQALLDAGASDEDAAWLRWHATEALAFIRYYRNFGLLERISETSIQVNLTGFPPLPVLGDMDTKWNKGSGWVTVERRADDLYVDGARVELFLTVEQAAGEVYGHDLHGQLRGGGSKTLHPNIAAALQECPDLIPPAWTRPDDQGKAPLICFWEAAFQDGAGDVYICCLTCSEGRPHLACCMLDDNWDRRRFAATRV